MAIVLFIFAFFLYYNDTYIDIDSSPLVVHVHF